MDIQTIRRKRLGEAIQDKTSGNVAAFGRLVKKSPTQLNDMLAGRKAFGEKVAREIEHKAHLPRLSLDAADVALVARTENREGYVRFPLLEGYAGMGQGDYMPDLPEVVEFVDVARAWAEWKLRGIPLDQVRVITGRGDSMRGEFEHGDLIFVDARVKRFLADSAYVFRWHGRVQVKRLQHVGNGLVRILSHNPAYPPIDVPVDELEIGGRALAAWTLKEF